MRDFGNPDRMRKRNYKPHYLHHSGVEGREGRMSGAIEEIGMRYLMIGAMGRSLQEFAESTNYTDLDRIRGVYTKLRALLCSIDADAPYCEAIAKYRLTSMYFLMTSGEDYVLFSEELKGELQRVLSAK